MAKIKFERVEIEAAGYYHGMLNLGIWDEKDLIKEVLKYKDRPEVILRAFRGLVTSVAETDEMFGAMCDEINEWNKRMKKGDDFCVTTWLGAKEGKTSREVFPNIGGKKK
jgi:hypothetical protein